MCSGTGRDDGGSLAHPGIYFLRVASGRTDRGRPLRPGALGFVTGAVARLVDVPPRRGPRLLREDPNATPAHRPDVWHALATTLPGTTVGFIAVEDERGLAGGAPVAIERRAGLRWLHALPYALGGAPLARQGMHRVVDDAVAVALAGLQRELELVGGDWTLYRPVGPEVAAETLERARRETRAVEIARIDLAGRRGRDAAAAGSRRTLRLRRARSRGLTFVEDPAALEAAYALHLAQSRRWSGYRPLPLELSRRLLAPPGGPAGPAVHGAGSPRRPARGRCCSSTTRASCSRGGAARVTGSREPRHALPVLVGGRVGGAIGSRAPQPGRSSRDRLARRLEARARRRTHAYRMRWLDASRAVRGAHGGRPAAAGAAGASRGDPGVRIATLANAAVIHTRRWVEHFRARGHDVRAVLARAAPAGLSAVTAAARAAARRAALPARGASAARALEALRARPRRRPLRAQLRAARGARRRRAAVGGHRLGIRSPAGAAPRSAAQRARALRAAPRRPRARRQRRTCVAAARARWRARRSRHPHDLGRRAGRASGAAAAREPGLPAQHAHARAGLRPADAAPRRGARAGRASPDPAS